MPSESLSPRPLRLSQKIRNLRLTPRSSGEREREQEEIPFRAVHTPDRPDRIITPIEAPSEQECGKRIASWHQAVLEDARFNSDKDSWADWTSETSSDYGDGDQQVVKEKGEAEHSIEDTAKGHAGIDRKPSQDVLSRVYDERYSYGGASMASPFLGEAEAAPLTYRNDSRKVSHHPLLAKSRYAPEQLRQTYATEENGHGDSKDVKEKDRAASPVLRVPPKSSARSPSAPRDQRQNRGWHTTTDRRAKSESPAGSVAEKGSRKPETSILKPRGKKVGRGICPYCDYDFANEKPLNCPWCRRGLTTFPSTYIAPPPLRDRRRLRDMAKWFPAPKERLGPKQRLDISLRRLRAPPPSPSPTIWPAPSAMRESAPYPRKPTGIDQFIKRENARLPPPATPPPAAPLPVIPLRRQTPSDRRPHIMDSYSSSSTSRTSSAGTRRTDSPGPQALPRSRFYHEPASKHASLRPMPVATLDRAFNIEQSRHRRDNDADVLSDIISSYSDDSKETKHAAPWI